MRDQKRNKVQSVGTVEQMNTHLCHPERRRKKVSRWKKTKSAGAPSRFGKLLDRLKPNDHLALIYESEAEWHEVVIPFVASGLNRGERCFYLLGTRTEEEIRKRLVDENIDVTAAESKGQLLILHYSDICRTVDRLDPQGAIRMIAAEAKGAREEGYAGLRVTTEADALPWDQDPDAILEYEARLNRDLFPKYPCSALCQYDRWEAAPDMIKNAIFTHPLLIRADQIHKNFYYIPPEELLAQKRDESEVQDMLDSIEQEGETQKRVRLLADVLDRSLQPFSAFYPDGRIMFCNYAFSRLTGYTEEELRSISLPVDLLSCEGGQVRVFERELLRKDGSVVSTEVFLHGIHDAEGSLQYYYAFITDISERRRAGGVTVT